jgi:hypothetical protein
MKKSMILLFLVFIIACNKQKEDIEPISKNEVVPKVKKDTLPDLPIEKLKKLDEKKFLDIFKNDVRGGSLLSTVKVNNGNLIVTYKQDDQYFGSGDGANKVFVEGIFKSFMADKRNFILQINIPIASTQKVIEVQRRAIEKQFTNLNQYKENKDLYRSEISNGINNDNNSRMNFLQSFYK